MLRAAQFRQLGVVTRAGSIVKITQQMRCRYGDSGSEQQEHFHQSGSAPISVAKGMDPGEVNMSYDSLDDGHGNAHALHLGAEGI